MRRLFATTAALMALAVPTAATAHPADRLKVREAKWAASAVLYSEIRSGSCNEEVERFPAVRRLRHNVIRLRYFERGHCEGSDFSEDYECRGRVEIRKAAAKDVHWYRFLSEECVVLDSWDAEPGTTYSRLRAWDMRWARYPD